MKTKTIFYISILLLILSCASSKKAYQLPDEMLPQVQVEYDKLCAKGQILYDINCARCHNTKVGRKTIIPDFDEVALQGYALRISNSKHEENMPDSLVSEEELVLISTFLRYKTPAKKK